MKSLTMVSMASCVALAALAGCTTESGNSRMASHDTTVEYYRVFDIRTDASPQAVAQAASSGIHRNLKHAVIALPEGVQVAEQPGRFRMADPAAASAGPNCEGAAWTAKAAPKVRGGDNMNVLACLFPYKSGYHLDMYTVFTKPEGGWLYWPRRLGGALLGTPEHFTDDTMVDVVRAIREATGAQVTLVEAKPTLNGTPWLDAGKDKAKVASAAPPKQEQASSPAQEQASAPSAP